MELDFLQILNNYTLEVVLISIGAFLLTYLIKLPIKKATSRLTEEKRRMVNVVIVFIPLIICYVSTTLYYGFTQNDWISFLILDCSLSSWLLSLSLYAVISKIFLIIKGVISGKVQSKDITNSLLTLAKNNIKTLSNKLKVDEKQMTSCIQKIEELMQVKTSILENTNIINLEELTKINSEIDNLTNQKNQLDKDIENEKKLIEKYKQQI